MSPTDEIHRALSVDTSGDFVVLKRDFKSNLIKEAILSSLFNIRRAYDLPDVDFASTSREVPNQPKPVSAGPPSLLSETWSWFGGVGSMTGEQVDALCTFRKILIRMILILWVLFAVAGPDRPIPQPPRVQSATTAHGPSTAARVSAEAQSTQSNIYARLSSALGERG
jgi:syntaxin-binding protein 5